MADLVLEVNGLSKRFGKLTAVNNISFSVRKGEVYGILGPNGSGKTTTLGMLLGVLNSSGGTFSWFGNGTSDTNRLRVGALLETPNFYSYLNAVDNLRIVARIRQIANEEQAILSALRLTGLEERKTSKFNTFSLGMKQRLAIASALLSDPEVLVLDEPTNGLDPVGIADIRKLIKDLARSGKTIILASHILDEMEKICTRVSIMRFGTILRTEDLHDLIGSSEHLYIRSEQPKHVQEILSAAGLPLIEDKGALLVFNGTGKRGTEINKLLAQHDIFCDELYIRKKSLETVFLEILATENEQL